MNISDKSLAGALALLNHDNDAQWTADGAPKLEAVRFLAKDASVSREDIVRVAPNFTRNSLSQADVAGVTKELPPALTELEIAQRGVESAEAEVDRAAAALRAAREKLDALQEHEPVTSFNDTLAALFAQSDKARAETPADAMSALDASRIHRRRGR